MRYNPPPNWPSPPPQWDPPPGWTPDPAWPPPPEGWQLFIDDAADDKDPVAAGQPAGGEAEYRGAHRTESDASAQGTDPPNPGPHVAVLGVEVSTDQLSVEHLGRKAMIRWADHHRYEIGTITAISADPAQITVHLGSAGSISFARNDSRDGNPRLYVWT